MYRTPKLLALAGTFAATILAVGAISPATAATTVRVSYQDLDLGTSAGQTMLTERLQRASMRVCSSEKQVMLDMTMACRSEAMDRARADLSAVLGTAPTVALR
jgi:UrcA family protein